MGIRISKDHLHPSVIESITSLIGDLSQLETTAKGNAVEAINELLANGGNKEELEALIAEITEGKELIANAVGEPLTAEESFDEMSNDINGLLSTFKTNMMNNGITVESGDKFKSLIDKIATMVEEGSGKGIQYASGITSNNFSNVQINGVNFTCLNISLNFKPTILIVRNHGNYGFYIEDFYPDNFNIVTVDNGSDEYRNVKNYEIDKGNNNYSIPIGYVIQKETTYYWAVGVGEEDTTLRDSLADILENKGVDVTEEDDMASLITKVDSISGGLDIISATELPATGRENQICVITDNPVDNYVVTNDYDYSDTTNIILYNGLKNSAPLINIVSGSVAQQYYITKIIQNDKYKLLESYYWSSNQWNSLTKSYVVIVQDGIVQNTDIIGGIKSQTYVMSYDKNSGSLLTPYSTNYSDSYVGATTTKKIDFGKYNTVTITAKVSNGSRYIYVGTATYSDNMAGQSTIYLDNFFTSYLSRNLTSTSYVDLTFDISGYTGEHYIAFGFSKASNGEASSVYIKDIKLS